LAEEKPTEGTVYFQSTNIHKLRRNAMNQFRRKIGTIFQDFRLLPNKTAYENIAFAMEVAGKPMKKLSQMCRMSWSSLIWQKMFSFPNQLSGGEKQRVAIARAIVNHPDIIIADEPTGNLIRSIPMKLSRF
jgi:cell division transport system ATP-binding protein